MRRLTRAVYDGAAARRGDPEERPRVRVLPGPGALCVLVVVLLLITAASVWRSLSGTPEVPVTQAGMSGGSPQDLAADGLPTGNQTDEDTSSGNLPTGTPAGSGGGAVLHTDPTGTQVVVVYVTGQVQDPGVVELPAGSRVGDAVEAVGGAGPGADLAAVNMARVLVDGEHIVLPAPGETVPDPGGATGSAGGGADAGTSAVGATCVDLNTADEQGLQALDGIGPALAGRIVAHRDQVGSFTSVEQLDDVPGIGPALVQRISQDSCQ